VTREYKVPYLQHPNSNIITIQHKAWMDTVRVCMWIDLQLGPHFDAKRGYAGLVWDNCGPHGVAAVKELASAWGISRLPLPPNMTDVLQVMDLVVNAPVKAKVRRDRVTKLYNDFQAWTIRRLQATIEKKDSVPFNPAKPKVVDGLRTLLSMRDTTFAEQRFKESLARSFVDCCIAPANVTDTDVEFKIYKNHKHGSLNPHGLGFSNSSTPADPEHGSLGVVIEAIDATLVETRNDAEDRALSDCDSDSASEDE
jgi:hypothetical protein